MPSPARTSPVSLTKLLHALSDPTRLEIVSRLARGPVLCGGFADLGTKTALSYHFRVLRLAGLTNTEKQGTCRLISLRREEVERAFPRVLESVLANARPPSKQAAARTKSRST